MHLYICILPCHMTFGESFTVTSSDFISLESRWKLVQDDPKLSDNGGEIPKEISRKRLAVRFLAVKSPLYLTEDLSCGQLCLVCFGVGMSAFCLGKEEGEGEEEEEEWKLGELFIPLALLHQVIVWGPLTRHIQIMWSIGQLEMAQVHFTLDP